MKFSQPASRSGACRTSYKEPSNRSPGASDTEPPAFAGRLPTAITNARAITMAQENFFSMTLFLLLPRLFHSCFTANLPLRIQCSQSPLSPLLHPLSPVIAVTAKPISSKSIKTCLGSTVARAGRRPFPPLNYHGSRTSPTWRRIIMGRESLSTCFCCTHQVIRFFGIDDGATLT